MGSNRTWSAYRCTEEYLTTDTTCTSQGGVGELRPKGSPTGIKTSDFMDVKPLRIQRRSFFCHSLLTLLFIRCIINNKKAVYLRPQDRFYNKINNDTYIVTQQGHAPQSNKFDRWLRQAGCHSPQFISRLQQKICEPLKNCCPSSIRQVQNFSLKYLKPQGIWNLIKYFPEFSISRHSTNLQFNANSKSIIFSSISCQTLDVVDGYFDCADYKSQDYFEGHTGPFQGPYLYCIITFTVRYCLSFPSLG